MRRRLTMIFRLGVFRFTGARRTRRLMGCLRRERFVGWQRRVLAFLRVPFGHLRNLAAIFED